MRKRVRVIHRFLQASAFTAVFLTAAGATQGATVEAKSPALADVKSAIASAHEGDTVTVPAGEASWTSTLVITKGITLQGATSIGGNLSNPVVTDKTVILDDVVRQSRGHPLAREQQGPPQQAKPLLSRTAAVRGQKDGPSKLDMAAGREGGHMPAIVVVTLKPDAVISADGLHVQIWIGYNVCATMEACIFTGTCPSARIDHCHFDQLYANPFIMTRGQIYGVVDHCVFDERGRALTFQVYHDGWGGHTHGDGSWADNTYFGSEKFLFIEDNTFRNAKGYKVVGIDAYGGGRYVARHNYMVDTSTGGHGTETPDVFEACAP